jgi:NADH-quinone oxidoreductase subunit M
MGSTLLILMILLPLVAAGGVVLAPASRSRLVAMLSGVAGLVLAGMLLLVFQWERADAIQHSSSMEWLPKIGLSISLGVDGVSMLLIALTALLGPICVAASTTAITERVKTYYAWLLVLQAAMVGVFAARDLIFFYVCFEFTLIPMFVLINLYGSTNRAKAATRFFLYTFTGSVVALAGLIYVAWHHTQIGGGVAGAEASRWTFDISTLALSARTMSSSEQTLVMFAMLLGFAVKVPLFPFHTWLPLAHTEAPTAGSVLLAGVLLKLGTYGIYRFVLPFTPMAVVEYAPLLATLCIIGVIYGGLICWVQTDVKKLVAYSSVAHLGFCMLGMFSLNQTGISGSVVYMINHGLSTGALFLLIGMIYERYHTRSMRELGGLAAKMPVWATFMVFFAMASVGLPGLNGFVGEFMCLMGTFQASDGWATGSYGVTDASQAIASTPGELGPAFALVAGFGMIIAAIYLLYMVGKVVFGPLVEPGSHAEHGHGGTHAAGHGSVLPADLNTREILTLAPLAILCLVFGLFPSTMLDAIAPTSRAAAEVAQAGRNQLHADLQLRKKARPQAGEEGAIVPASEAKPAEPAAHPTEAKP